jgi:hypothetical protein
MNMMLDRELGDDLPRHRAVFLKSGSTASAAQWSGQCFAANTNVRRGL